MTDQGRPGRPPPPRMSSLLTQMFPPKPHFTERDIPDLSGKVYIVTGSSSGAGKEVAQILYSKNARVYVAARSEEKMGRVMTEIEKTWPDSKGSLIYLPLDLADLTKVKEAAEQFNSKESKLNALFNNAAVQALTSEPPDNLTAQGYEIHMGVNVLGGFLFTKLLTPTLVATAKIEPANTVRVVWVSSTTLELAGEEGRGIRTEYQDYWPNIGPLQRYSLSKAGNWLYAVEFASRHRADGVVSIPCNPGGLRSDLFRDGAWWFKFITHTFFTYPAVNGAYTELYSALSPDVTMDKTGSYVIPWGRLHYLREDLEAAKRTQAEGGNGHAKKFWEWSEEQTKKYL